MIRNVRNAFIGPSDLPRTPSSAQEFEIDPAQRNIIKDVLPAKEQEELLIEINDSRTLCPNLVQPTRLIYFPLNADELNSIIMTPKQISRQRVCAPMAVKQLILSLRGYPETWLAPALQFTA